MMRGAAILRKPFTPDQVHLSAQGYAVLGASIRSKLTAATKP